jgi:hypothetical protein
MKGVALLRQCWQTPKFASIQSPALQLSDWFLFFIPGGESSCARITRENDIIRMDGLLAPRLAVGLVGGWTVQTDEEANAVVVKYSQTPGYGSGILDSMLA